MFCIAFFTPEILAAMLAASLKKQTFMVSYNMIILKKEMYFNGKRDDGTQPYL